MPSVRPRKPTARFRRLCSFFLSFFTHTPSRASSPRGRRRDPPRKRTRRRRVAAAVGAAPDSSSGCRMQQTQPAEKHLQLQLVAVQHVDADAHSFLLHSAVHIWHVFCAFSAPPLQNDPPPTASALLPDRVGGTEKVHGKRKM